MLFSKGTAALHTVSLFNMAGTVQNSKKSAHQKRTSFITTRTFFVTKVFIAHWDKFLFGCLRFYLIRIIPPMLHDRIYLFIYHRHYMI